MTTSMDARMNKRTTATKPRSAFQAQRIKMLIVLFSAALFSPLSAPAADVNTAPEGPVYSISAGVISTPTFVGDDESQTIILPNVSVKYGDFFSASLYGVEYVARRKGDWRFGTAVSYDFGRAESAENNPLYVAASPSTDLQGMGDIDGTFEIGGFVQYKVKSYSAKLKVLQGLNGGHDGLKGEASASYSGQVNVLPLPLFYSVGPTISFGNDTYNNTFFGVSADQSVASGLNQYDADAGINSVGFKATAILPLSRNTSIISFIEYSQLTGDAKDSSLVTERGSKDQTKVGLLFNYSL